MEYIMTFHTHFDAIQYQRFLKKHNQKGDLQPVPRALSSSCGTCVKFVAEKGIQEGHLLTKMEFEKLFLVDGGGYVLIVSNE